MKTSVLLNEYSNSAEYWLKAAADLGIEIESIDLFSEKWLDEINRSSSKLFLVCPSGVSSLQKRYYDEKLEIITNTLGKKIYPNLLEVKIHENKRYLYQWLMAKNIPHPKTWVFLKHNEALEFLENATMPMVVKIAIGASGHNVHIFENKVKLKDYVNRTFKSGISPKSGPNLKMGNWNNRIQLILNNPMHILERLSIYKKTRKDIQHDYVILQEYIPHEYEWRVVRIGDSYFGHQKVKQGKKASGSKGINYSPPPEDLLNFVQKICEANGFRSMAVDLFEDGKGGYLVNELQTAFGHVQDHICEVAGKPGRFIHSNQHWLFEEGLFNGNLSYNLRLEDAVRLIRN